MVNVFVYTLNNDAESSLGWTKVSSGGLRMRKRSVTCIQFALSVKYVDTYIQLLVYMHVLGNHNFMVKKKK